MRRKRCCLPLAGKYSRTEKRRGALGLSPRQQRDGAGQHHYRSFPAQHAAAGFRTALQASPTLPLDLRQFRHQEQQLLEQSLKTAKYNQKRAAELLGLTYHQLRALLKKHQMR
jgi:transcriptional regulator with AAA-type ATPase domain